GGLAGGLSSLIIFREIVARVHAAVGGPGQARKLCKVMAGTGTGALIACMLGLLGMNIDLAIAAYSRLVESVFSETKMISMSGSGTFKASKLEEELKKIVRDATGDENTRIVKAQQDEQDCKVMVFAMSEYNLNASTPRIFRSYRVPKNEMPNCPIWQALRASMAHPELFKSIRVGDNSSIAESLIGGDVACSNPTAHVLTEVSALYPEGHISSIICIGAGHARTIEIPRSNPLHRVMPTNVLIAMKNVATDSERVAQEMAERFQHTPDVYFRLSVDQGMQNASLSQWQNHGEAVAHTRAYMHKAGTTRLLDEAVKAIIVKSKTLRTTAADGKAQQLSVRQATGVKRCPAPSPAFTGCERQVSQAVNCLLSPANERRVCVVHGLGGSGKTQIALKTVERTKDKWADIIYVDATTRESTTASLNGFALAKKLGETHEDTLQWLELASQRWLLVFDNADDPGLGISKFIPGGSCGSVLITTRLRTLVMLRQPHGPESDCAVSGMDEEEGLELLLKRARIQHQTLPSDELESATQLVRDLGYLALAIVHAGAYIWCSKCSFVDYRKQCLEHTRFALERYSKLPGYMEQYEKTVYTTWEMSYQRLQPRTQQLLKLMAYLHHGGITEEIFERAARNRDYTPAIPLNEEQNAIQTYVQKYLEQFLDAQGRWKSTRFSAIIDELLVYSLIDFDRVNKVYTLHVLVQDWACTMISRSNTEALAQTIRLLALSIDDSDEVDSHTHRARLNLHVNKLETLGEIDEDTSHWFAQVHAETGQWREEERLRVKVVDARKRALGEQHPDTLTSISKLALTYQYQGRWDEAAVVQTQVLEARKQVLGERHPDTLSSMDNLASAYQSQGRWDEAEALHVQVLEARRQVLGERHPNTLTSMDNLATVFRSQGRWDEAEVLQTQVLEARKQVLGERHPDSLGSMNNLALTYQDQGRWGKAETLHTQALDGWRQAVGERHPDTLISMGNLALTYESQGRWDEAETLHTQALDGWRQAVGERHPGTLNSMDNLAGTYESQGRFDEAEVLHTQVLDARKQVLSERHPDILLSMNSLAMVYQGQGRWDKAETLQTQVLEAKKQVFGERHPSTLASMNNLALTYQSQGRWNEAVALHLQVLNVAKQVLGERHPNTLESMHSLAEAYRLQNQWDEAETLHMQAFEAKKQVLGEWHPDTITSMHNLSLLFLDQDQFGKAEPFLIQSLAANKRVSGEAHSDTLKIMVLLIATYEKMGPERERELKVLLAEWDELELETAESGEEELEEEEPGEDELGEGSEPETREEPESELQPPH
ncbi:hypothetical protein FRC09_012163, partial [Ceratobasidium sp. 395]